MTDDHEDLTELLRAANPVADDQLPLPADSPGAQLLYERITGTPYAGSVPARTRRHRIGPGLAALVAVVALGLGSAFALSNNSVSRHLAVSCYAGPSLQSEVVAVDAEDDGPVATCSHAWQAGHVGPGPVPLLAACVTAKGVAAVFPTALGADVCGQLGLPALPAGASTLPPKSTSTLPTTTVSPNQLPAQLRVAVVTQLQARCLTAPQAVTTITGLLAKAKVPWRVAVPTPFPPGRPCASPGFDESTDTVILTGIPPVAGSGQ